MLNVNYEPVLNPKLKFASFPVSIITLCQSEKFRYYYLTSGSARESVLL